MNLNSRGKVITQFAGGAVFISAKDADLKWWKSLAMDILRLTESKGSHFCLMKNNLLWVSVEGEKSEFLQHACRLELKDHFCDTEVTIDPLCAITESMISDVVDFKYNDDCVVKIDGTLLPNNHLIITYKEDSILGKEFNTESYIAHKFRKFIKDFKKIWPQLKDQDFHFILFKKPPNNYLYLYIHVEDLGMIGLNTTFKRIGYDFIGVYFTEILTLEKIEKWAVSFENLIESNKNSLWA